MMPVIRINDGTFSDLKTISKWLEIETPSKTIESLVSEMMNKLDLEREVDSESSFGTSGDKPLVFKTAPGLAFTKILNAKINGKEIQRPNWAGLLIEVISVVRSKGIIGNKLVNELEIPAKEAQYLQDGYKYHQNIGLSVQGQSAQDAWREIDRLSKKWEIPVVINFKWRDNPKAQHPGSLGCLSSGAIQ
jgi:hypothetical protein